MVYKKFPGSTLQWSINLPDIRSRTLRMHCPVSLLIKRNREEMHILIDSLAHLVDLLIREFDDGLNLIGVPPLAFKRAFISISDYFSLDDDFISDLEWEYFKFVKESGIESPFGVITPLRLSELYERSMTLKKKLSGAGSKVDDLKDAITIIDTHIKMLDS